VSFPPDSINIVVCGSSVAVMFPQSALLHVTFVVNVNVVPCSVVMFVVGFSCETVIVGVAIVGQPSFGVSMHVPHVPVAEQVCVPGQDSVVVHVLVCPLVQVMFVVVFEGMFEIVDQFGISSVVFNAK